MFIEVYRGMKIFASSYLLILQGIFIKIFFFNKVVRNTVNASEMIPNLINKLIKIYRTLMNQMYVHT